MISTTLNGRCGNQFFSIAFLLQYAKKYDLEYHIPAHAAHCDGNKMYFPQTITSNDPGYLADVYEQTVHAIQKEDGTYEYNIPTYKEWDKMDNVRFIGYWQTFKYFDWCRDYILEKFAIPWMPTSMVSIHIRRGDFLQLADKHPSVPLVYYYRAIEYFQKLGYNDFLVFSDDIEWCKNTLISPSANLMYQEGQDEYTDLWCMSSCAHNIICYSTFGFIGSWLNQNPDKIVLIPESKYCFSGAHQDFIPSYFTQLEIE